MAAKLARFAQRQAGSATRLLTMHLLAQAGIDAGRPGGLVVTQGTVCPAVSFLIRELLRRPAARTH